MLDLYDPEKQNINSNEVRNEVSLKKGSQRSRATTAPALSNRELGQKGEHAAQLFLERKGYRILERNWVCFAGEADIIARCDDILCFVEVKTRRGLEKGFPAEAVNDKKRARYEKIAACYLQQHADFVDVRVRFDVISILVLSDTRAFLRMHTDAFGIC